MAGPSTNAMLSEPRNPELESTINTRISKVTGYGQAIARLGDTIDDECMSILKSIYQYWQTKLKFHEKRNEKIVRMVHAERLATESRAPIISVAELLQVASAEAKALKEVTTLYLSLVQLKTNRAGFKQKLQNIRNARGQAHNGPNDTTDTMGDESEIQDLEKIIEEHEDKIREHDSWMIQQNRKVWAAMEAANLAAKSDIEVPGIGRWSSSSALTTITAALISAPTTVTTPLISTPATVTTAPTTPTSAPIIVNTAQVKVADIPSAVKAAAKDPQASVDSNVVATVPRSTTAIVKVDSTLSTIALCAPQKQYANVKSVEQKEFVVGDIGWFPVLRPSLSESSSDIHTEFGYICAKSYPLLVVERLEDCMLGLIISTSNGNGLLRKSTSVKSRSALVGTESSRNPTSLDWGQELFFRRMLRVEGSSEYSPPAGAYVDMLNVVMIPYDTRFQKKGSLVKEHADILQRMRLSAVLAQSEAGKLGNLPNFWNWFGGWFARWCKAA